MGFFGANRQSISLCREMLCVFESANGSSCRIVRPALSSGLAPWTTWSTPRLPPAATQFFIPCFFSMCQTLSRNSRSPSGRKVSTKIWMFSHWLYSGKWWGQKEDFGTWQRRFLALAHHPPPSGAGVGRWLGSNQRTSNSGLTPDPGWLAGWVSASVPEA